MSKGSRQISSVTSGEGVALKVEHVLPSRGGRWCDVDLGEKYPDGTSQDVPIGTKPRSPYAQLCLVGMGGRAE